jgi:hypothetical protein
MGLLGMIHQQHPPAGRVDQIRAGDQADRAPAAVDHHGGAVVDLTHLFGDVAEDLLGTAGQRVGLHQRTAGSGQRDHPARHIGVERRDDDRRALLLGQLDDLRIRSGVVGDDEQRGAQLDAQSLGIAAVAHHDHVAFGDAAPGGHIHRVHPDPAGQLPVLTGDQVTVQNLQHRLDVGGLAQDRALAALPDVAAGQGAARHHPHQRSVVVDHGDHVEVGLRHIESRLADRVLAVDGGELGLHHVARPEQDVGKELRLGQFALFQHPPCLGVQVP